MSKKTLLFLASFIFLTNFHFAYAEIIINEIQLNPIEERFIELYNSGNSVVDLTDWYIQRKTKTQIQNGSDFSSLVSKPNFLNKMIGPGKYFLISKNMNNSDIVLENLTLTESNIIQIKNLNQEVVDKIGWGDININDCGGICALNPTDGKSIQKTSNGWIIAIPTPGKQNQNTNIENTTEQNINIQSSSTTVSSSQPSSSSVANTKNTELQKIKTKIIAKEFGFVDIPIEFIANTILPSGAQPIYGNYFWNFGDGDFKEIKTSDNQKFTHRYFYPGEYIVSLEYFINPYSSVADSEDKITITIVPAEIIISKVGEKEDFFVELTNNTKYDVNISNWILTSEENITKNNINELKTKSFIFPKNTILGTKKKIILPSKITNLSFIDNGNLKLLNMNNDIIFDYTFGKEKDLEIYTISRTTISRTPLDIKERQIEPPVISENQNINQIELSTDSKFNNNLASNAILSSPSFNLNSNPKNIKDSSFLSQNSKKDFLKNIKVNSYFLIFIILLLSSASAVYFIRNKKIKRNIAEDFEILDE